MNEDDQMEKPASVEEGTEDVVLTRWEKLKKWFEIAMATKKLYMFVMSLLVGSTGVTIHDQLTNSTTFKDVAEQVGLIDKDQPPTLDLEKEIQTEGGAYITRDEWSVLVGHLEAHEHDSSHEHSTMPPVGGESLTGQSVGSHSHDWEMPEHTHDSEHTHEIASHEHPEAPHKHADHIHVNHAHSEYAPVGHTHAVSAGSIGGIDDAFERHIQDDH